MSELLYVGHDSLDDLAKVVTTATPLFHGLLQKEVNRIELFNQVRMRVIFQLTNLQEPYLHYWNIPLWQYLLENGKVIAPEGDEPLAYNTIMDRVQVGAAIVQGWVQGNHSALEVLPGILKLPEGCALECWPARVLVLDRESKIYRRPS